MKLQLAATRTLLPSSRRAQAHFVRAIA